MIRDDIRQRIAQGLWTAHDPALIGCAEPLGGPDDNQAAVRILRWLRSASADPEHSCLAVIRGTVLFGFTSQRQAGSSPGGSVPASSREWAAGAKSDPEAA